MANLFKGTNAKQVPKNLGWTSEPPQWVFDDFSKLVMQPPAGTDLNCAFNCAPKVDACYLYTKIRGDFTFTTRVGGSLPQFGDAVAATIWADQTSWAKVGVQRAKTGQLRIVSSVTQTFSDEAFGEFLRSADAILRIIKRGNQFIMHWSRDNKKWHFIRVFVWNNCPPELCVGVHTQAPNSGIGECIGEFHDFTLTNDVQSDIFTAPK
eukprot:TRINITY_DN105_c1_g2_i1.p1 TRINITY_DN105_c1_g2~~TRINITY_DN105_c1_g2_i1.p1  ORF type:complete len:208 (+),score=106.21 TRINITY_DN105_c1_g2_i1:73-696(+)